MTPIAEHWARLGLEPTDDEREIKRAYGRALKTIDPDSDPQAFLALREAYETARQWGAQTPWWERDEPDGEAEASAAAAAETDFPDGDAPAGNETGDGDWWEGWRPDPPAAVGAEGLRDACLELDRLLFDPADPGPDALLGAGRAVLDHPELAKVDRLAETELWLAETICAASPRSDALIASAVLRFGWDRAAQDWRRAWPIDQVLRRREDLDFLEACRAPWSRHGRALAELSGPPRRRLPIGQLHLAKDVRDFLQVVDSWHPTLELDLDSEALGWWRDYLHGPHLPPSFLFWITLGPLAAAFAAALLLQSRHLPLAWLPAVLAASALLIFAVLKLKARSDARARERLGTDGTGPGRGLAWLAAAALLAPAAAALLPAGAVGTTASWLAASLLAVGGLARGWIDHEWNSSLRLRVFLPVLAAILGALVVALQPADRAALLIAPLASLCWLGSRLFAPVRSFLEDRRRWRIAAPLVAFTFLMVGAVPILWTAGDSPPQTLVAIPIAIIAVHWATAASPVDLHVVEWPSRVAGLLAWFLAPTAGRNPFAARLLLAIAVYALIYAAVRAFAAFLGEAERTGPPDSFADR